MLKPKGVMILTLVFTLLSLSCAGPESDQPLLTAEVPLHLEEHLEAATIESSEVPEDIPAPVEWRFDEPQPDWKAAGPIFSEDGTVHLEPIEDALRIHFTEEANRTKISKNIVGAIYVDLPDWRREEWGDILVRAQTSGPFRNVRLFYNLGERMQPNTNYRSAVLYAGDRSPMVSDGDVHTYKLRVDVHREAWGEWEDPWRQLILYFVASKPASIDFLSVSVIPKEYNYADAPVGVKTIDKRQEHRRAIYTHTPGSIEYRVRIPESGRFDFGLGVIREDIPVTFKILASQGDNEEIAFFEENYANPREWGERYVDLSGMTGKTVTIALTTDAEQPGTVALWTAPTISGLRMTKKPNVIFYVIDGGGADFMSVYGYNRRTTPFMDKLAAEGAVFERAYSNSSWSKPSTTSFMTSLQNSVLGNIRGRFDPLPEEAVTMAQHFHRAGYQTAVFTSNAWAGSISSLDREVDVMRDFGAENDATSSVELHEDFWNWREAYPAAPYWVHFQTTDVHEEDFPAVAPFSGLFVGPEEKKTWMEWYERLWEEGGHGIYSEAYEKTGISRVEVYTLLQGMYDEKLAHNDYQLGRLVERLKAEGEWENTLLIIGADHSIRAAMGDLGIAIQDSLPPRWGHPIFRPSISRVPLLFIWPGHIEGGQRFSDPVSNIDVLPTVLDLAGLPPPEAMQGRSLAPLLLGTGDVEPRPVIFDEFWRTRLWGMSVDNPTGELQGVIEVVDGRWGASLWIGPEAEDEDWRRPMPLLLFDLWNDPWCLSPVNEQHPDLVERYTTFLEAQWEAHQALAQHFTPGGDVELTPEQLETLRSLGYIR